jgi:hypothetical protein
LIREEKDRAHPKIFLSYSAEDHAQALKLRSLFSQHSNSEIFTIDKLSAGEDWASRLKIELSTCDIFIVLLSPRALESSWVLHEIGAAWGLGKRIIAIYTHSDIINRIPVTLDENYIVDIKDLENPDFVSHLLERCEEEAATLHK